MFSEISVTIKDSEKRLTKKYPTYASYSVQEDDPVIKECVEETLKNFGDEPDDIKVRITMEIK